MFEDTIDGVQNIGNDLFKRGDQFKRIFEQTANGDINPLETGVQTVGTVIGAFGDLTFNAVSTMVKQSIPEPVENYIGEKVSNASDYFFNTRAGKWTVGKMNASMEMYSDFKEDHPRAAANIEGVFNIASAIPVVKGAQVAKESAKQIFKGSVDDVVRNVVKSAKGKVDDVVKFANVKTYFKDVKVKSFGKVVYEGDIDLKDTLKRIDSGDVGEHIYPNDGTEFKNYFDDLPLKEAGYYKEYWVEPSFNIKAKDNPMRIVEGANGERWFSPHHYEVFIKIK